MHVEQVIAFSFVDRPARELYVAAARMGDEARIHSEAEKEKKNNAYQMHPGQAERRQGRRCVPAARVSHSVLKVFDLPLPPGLASSEVPPMGINHRTIHLGRSTTHNSRRCEDLALRRPKHERIGGSKL